jgi:hypothetical protein
MRRDARGRAALARVARTFDDETAGAEDAHVADFRGGAPRELARQLAFRLAEAEQHALRALVDASAPRNRASPSTGSRTGTGRCGSRRARARARASLEVAQVDGAVGRDQELGQRELALAEDAERARSSPRACSARARPRPRARGSRSRRSSRGRRHAGITTGKSGESSSWRKSPMKKSSWRGLPTTVAGHTDRVAAVTERLDVKTG